MSMVVPMAVIVTVGMAVAVIVTMSSVMLARVMLAGVMMPPVAPLVAMAVRMSAVAVVGVPVHSQQRHRRDPDRAG